MCARLPQRKHGRCAGVFDTFDGARPVSGSARPAPIFLRGRRVFTDWRLRRADRKPVRVLNLFLERDIEAFGGKPGAGPETV